MRTLGEAVAVAPDAQRSAVGHAITTLNPLRATEYSIGDEYIGYAVDGTPADCVKLGVGSLVRAKPDLIVSGINLGPNTATNIIYSGTVSAATEGRMLGIPSIAFSINSFHDALWDTAAEYAKRVAAQVLERGLPDRVLLNVNVPNLPLDEVRGVRLTRQGDSGYVEDFAIRQDPRGQTYYWLAGAYQMSDSDPDTDAHALEEGYISVTPITYDLTERTFLGELGTWELDVRGR